MKRFRHCALAALTTFSVAMVLTARYGPAVDPGESGGRGAVVVARVPIPAGTEITAELLTTEPITNGSLTGCTFREIERVIGRVAVIAIGVREPVTVAKLAPIGTAFGLSSVIPEGYRAMTVKVDDVVGVSGSVMPGTFVDVVAVIDPPARSGQDERISKIVLQNIKVLANGQNIGKPKNDRGAERVRTVTLQVTPEQAEKLALASTEGRLQLVMRNSVDQSARPTPSAPAPPRISVEVIEGAKRRDVEFP